MFNCRMRYAYCPHCGTDLETKQDMNETYYKYKKHYVYLEDCEVCGIYFVTDFNGFCEIVDKNFANGHKRQNQIWWN